MPIIRYLDTKLFTCLTLHKGIILHTLPNHPIQNYGLLNLLKRKFNCGCKFPEDGLTIQKFPVIGIDGKIHKQEIMLLPIYYPISTEMLSLVMQTVINQIKRRKKPVKIYCTMSDLGSVITTELLDGTDIEVCVYLQD